MAFFGNIFFGFFGALIKWIFGLIKFYVYREKSPKSFMKVWFGDNEPDMYDTLSNDFSNKIIGFVFLMLFVCLIILIDKMS